MKRKDYAWYVHSAAIAMAISLALAAWGAGWINFGRPWWLFAWLVTPAFIWVSKRSLAGLPLRTNVWAATLRMLVWLILVAALADFQFVIRSRRLAVFFVIDRSASIPEDVQQLSLDYLKAALTTKGPRDLAGLIVFGEHPSIETLPATDLDPYQQASLVSPEFTNLESAVELAVSAFPPNSRRKIVLITDGNENAGNVMSAAEFAASAGVEISVLPVQYAIRDEVWVDHLRLPETVREGESFDIRARVFSTYAGPAELELSRNDIPSMAPQAVELQPGQNDFAFTVKIREPGFYVYQLRVRAARDTVPENNVASVSTQIRGRSRILFISADGQATGILNLLEICEENNIQTELCTPALAPTSLAQFQNYDSLVLADVPASAFSESQLELIRTCVRDSGMGLIMIGGGSSFGAGAWRDTPVEAALPVDMDIKQRQFRLQSAMILVLDCSGSMSGDKLKQAQVAATGALDALGPDDLVGIVAFDSQPGWLIRPTPAREQARIKQAIARLAPGGGTDIIAALIESHKVLSSLTVPIRHIILLSDGQSDDGGLIPLMRQVQNDRITVSTIGIGEQHGQPMMQQIAHLGNGRFHFVSDAQQLPRVFIQDIRTSRRNLVSDASFQPVIAMPTELIKGIRSDEMPPLGGYVLSAPKERAQVSITTDSEERDPILAQWRYGLGKSVAFTSDAGAQWAIPWLSWPAYRQIWKQILLWTTRTRETSHVTIRTEPDGDSMLLIIDAMDDQGRLFSFDQVEVRRIDPALETHRISLQQVGNGRYQARFDARDPGFNLIHLSYTHTGAAESAFVQTGVYVPPSPEYRQWETNLPLLKRLAKKGDPQEVLLPTDPLKAGIFLSNQPPSRSLQTLWELLLMLGILLLGADIVLRRVILSRNDLQQVWARLTSGQVQAEAIEHDQTLVNLRKRKQQVFQFARRQSADSPDKRGQESFQSRLRKEAAESPTRHQGIAPETADRPPAGKAERQDPPASAETTSQADTYTERLLQAKQRAARAQEDRDGD